MTNSTAIPYKPTDDDDLEYTLAQWESQEGYYPRQNGMEEGVGWAFYATYQELINFDAYVKKNGEPKDFISLFEACGKSYDIYSLFSGTFQPIFYRWICMCCFRNI